MKRRIETARLILRVPLLRDANDIFEYGSDYEVARYMDWPVVKSLDEITERIGSRKNDWKDRKYYWVIEDKDMHKVVGAFSATVKDEKAEIGYMLNRKYWGKGICNETGSAIIKELRESGITLLCATCDIDNARSKAALERLGFSTIKTIKKYLIRPNLDTTERDAIYFELR